MNHRSATLMEVLNPRRFRRNARRDQVTRTVIQPEVDRFEQAQDDGNATAACSGVARPIEAGMGANP